VPLTVAPCLPIGRRVHTERGTYQGWVYQRAVGNGVRYARMEAYDSFVERWPVLQDWFDAPLPQRMFDNETLVRGQNPHGGASVIMPYLTYLSLVHVVGLDYPILLGGSFMNPLTHQAATEAWASIWTCSPDTSPGWANSATPIRGRPCCGRWVECFCTAATQTSPRWARPIWTS
jgi:hypothetical protein